MSHNKAITDDWEQIEPGDRVQREFHSHHKSKKGQHHIVEKVNSVAIKLVGLDTIYDRRMYSIVTKYNARTNYIKSIKQY